MPQTMKNLVPFVSVIVLMCASASVMAQGTPSDNYPRVEVFAGYSALGEANGRGISFGPTTSTTDNYASPTGFQASVTGNFNRYFGIKGDFSAHLSNGSGRISFASCNPTCATVTQDYQFKTGVYNFLGGPELKVRNSTRFTPLVYALAGVAHTSATFTTSGPTLNLSLKNSDNSFAMALGGGFDIRATKRLSVRATMDYNPVFVNDSSTGRRDLARISLGVLIH